jgi:hypothetical protein
MDGMMDGWNGKMNRWMGNFFAAFAYLFPIFALNRKG